MMEDCRARSNSWARVVIRRRAVVALLCILSPTARAAGTSPVPPCVYSAMVDTAMSDRASTWRLRVTLQTGHAAQKGAQTHCAVDAQDTVDVRRRDIVVRDVGPFTRGAVVWFAMTPMQGKADRAPPLRIIPEQEALAQIELPDSATNRGTCLVQARITRVHFSLATTTKATFEYLKANVSGDSTDKTACSPFAPRKGKKVREQLEIERPPNAAAPKMGDVVWLRVEEKEWVYVHPTTTDETSVRQRRTTWLSAAEAAAIVEKKRK